MDTPMVEHVALGAALIAVAGLLLLTARARRTRSESCVEATSFKTLAEIAPAGMWRTDTRGQCLWVNKAWEDMSGLT